MIIYGAGMAGLLAASMLRRHRPLVYEAKASLPDNHKALLRFRSDAVSKATGIPFRKVRVQKAVWRDGELRDFCTIADNNAYSRKVTGRATNRSVLNLESSDRWIAPEDFIEQLAKTADIRYSSPLSSDVFSRPEENEPVISTIPLPVMAAQCGYNLPEDCTGSSPVWVVTCKLDDVDLYQTVYFPRDGAQYRASITGGTLIIELMTDPGSHVYDTVDNVLAVFGLNGVSYSGLVVTKQERGKVFSNDPDACRRCVLFLTDVYRIYSLGRFATWRQLLMDDVVQDVAVIDRLITQRDGYARALRGTK